MRVTTVVTVGESEEEFPIPRLSDSVDCVEMFLKCDVKILGKFGATRTTWRDAKMANDKADLVTMGR